MLQAGLITSMGVNDMRPYDNHNLTDGEREYEIEKYWRNNPPKPGVWSILGPFVVVVISLAVSLMFAWKARHSTLLNDLIGLGDLRSQSSVARGLLLFSISCMASQQAIYSWTIGDNINFDSSSTFHYFPEDCHRNISWCDSNLRAIKAVYAINRATSTRPAISILSMLSAIMLLKSLRLYKARGTRVPSRSRLMIGLMSLLASAGSGDIQIMLRKGRSRGALSPDKPHLATAVMYLMVSYAQTVAVTIIFEVLVVEPTIAYYEGLTGKSKLWLSELVRELDSQDTDGEVSVGQIKAVSDWITERANSLSQAVDQIDSHSSAPFCLIIATASTFTTLIIIYFFRTDCTEKTRPILACIHENTGGFGSTAGFSVLLIIWSYRIMHPIYKYTTSLEQHMAHISKRIMLWQCESGVTPLIQRTSALLEKMTQSTIYPNWIPSFITDKLNFLDPIARLDPGKIKIMYFYILTGLASLVVGELG